MTERIAVLTLAAGLLAGFGPAPAAELPRSVAIEFRGGRPAGQIRVADGKLLGARVARGQGEAQGSGRFRAAADGPFRLEIEVAGTEVRYAAGATVVTVATEAQPFSFFLRDATREFPIILPAYGVAVTAAADPRGYAEIEAAVRSRGLETKLREIENEPEESFEAAAKSVRDLRCPTWLGLSRDMRIFEVSERVDSIQPRFHGGAVSLPETGGNPSRYRFLAGRGWGPREDIRRSLDQAVLPVLRARIVDEDVTYSVTAFTTLESRPLTRENLRGTHYLVADGHGRGHMFTKEQQARYDELLPAEMNRPEETVLLVRITAVNTAPAPRYAFFKNLYPGVAAEWKLDPATGFAVYSSGRVFCISRLDGKPLASEELATLLMPGQTAVLEMYVPHRPVSPERAHRLAQLRFDESLEACRRFWKQKLDAAARVDVPERRIREMIRAGLLHLDLITYGLEPEGTLTSTIGVYSAIGSESSPIIQFMDSIGWHDVARRALMYFLDKQREDGFIQNFGNYMLETGAALWSIGEHYRYTRDREWVKQIAPRLVKACEYIARWRERNRREELRGRGYGMLEGKTADPADPYRSFMLNGYHYLGLSRAAEMLEVVDPAQGRRWRREAEDLKADIRTALAQTIAESPVVPLRDGTWSPTVPPWVEYRGPVMLFADGGKWFTHNSITTRDSLLGPLYLVFQEVVEPASPEADILLNFHNDLMTDRNVAFTQPYYSRHPVVHLMRGEVKPFLKAYYNTVASLADRGTYTFWEHYHGASPHKTHEEGWFLMDTRWMLYRERGEMLELLAGIPRRYLEDGKEIALERAASYFGPLTVRVTSRLSEDRIDATVECTAGRGLKTVELRLPHPDGRKAKWVKGGVYDPATERVRIDGFSGRAQVSVGF